jgi:hypothetical protein
MTVLVAFSLVMNESSCSFTSSPVFGIVRFWSFSILVGVKWYLLAVLISSPLMDLSFPSARPTSQLAGKVRRAGQRSKRQDREARGSAGLVLLASRKAQVRPGKLEDEHHWLPYLQENCKESGKEAPASRGDILAPPTGKGESTGYEEPAPILLQNHEG